MLFHIPCHIPLAWMLLKAVSGRHALVGAIDWGKRIIRENNRRIWIQKGWQAKIQEYNNKWEERCDSISVESKKGKWRSKNGEWKDIVKLN